MRKRDYSVTRETRETSRWRVVLRCMAGLLLVVAIVSTAIDPGTMWPNLAAETAGLAFTLLVVEAITAKQGEEREKRDLILQMGSPDNAFAREAVRKLRIRGWLDDGSLHKADLKGADLRGANLDGADLEEANLWEANLSKASLEGANLQRAGLVLANLEEADLEGANLWEANLVLANLTGAYLEKASLYRADLSSANLTGAKVTVEQLVRTNSLEGATLPDGTVHE